MEERRRGRKGRRSRRRGRIGRREGGGQARIKDFSMFIGLSKVIS